jgi:hypothetical protein
MRPQQCVRSLATDRPEMEVTSPHPFKTGVLFSPGLTSASDGVKSEIILIASKMLNTASAFAATNGKTWLNTREHPDCFPQPRFVRIR